jgi:hypothetical protein
VTAHSAGRTQRRGRAEKPLDRWRAGATRHRQPVPRTRGSTTATRPRLPATAPTTRAPPRVRLVHRQRPRRHRLRVATIDQPPTRIGSRPRREPGRPHTARAGGKAAKLVGSYPLKPGKGPPSLALHSPLILAGDGYRVGLSVNVDPSHACAGMRRRSGRRPLPVVAVFHRAPRQVWRRSRPRAQVGVMADQQGPTSARSGDR